MANGHVVTRYILTILVYLSELRGLMFVNLSEYYPRKYLALFIFVSGLSMPNVKTLTTYN